MLKHEEMIENVHRRIAQYEEEKNMKHSKLKNIFSAKKAEMKKEVTNNNEEEIEVVSGTDIVSSSGRKIHMISSIAASAVLVTSIGATSFLLHKNKPVNSLQSKVEVVCSESAKFAASDAALPFPDFKQVYFDFGFLNDYGCAEYSDATYERLADFLKTFNWGKGNEITESDIPDFDEYDGSGYTIFWKDGDTYFNVYVTDNGKAYYIKTKCTSNGATVDYPVIESLAFDIDYNVFNNGIKDIMSSNITDTSGYISQHDVLYLTQGEFLDCEVTDIKNYADFIPEDHKSYNALQGFFRDDFVGMLQKEIPVDYNKSEESYNVVCYYKINDTTTRRLTYYINYSGYVSLCEYDIIDNEEFPTGCSQYYIDFAELEAVLNDIKNGKYDDKYSFDIEETTESEITETVVNEETTESF